MKARSLAILGLGLTLSIVNAACTTEAVEEETQDLAAPRSLTLNLVVDDSRETYGANVVSFEVKDGDASNLPCRDQSLYLNSKPSLHDGWSSASEAAFADSVPGATFREYIFTACRNADKQVIGWFGKARPFELKIADQFLQSDYVPASLPLILQYRSLSGSRASYYTCEQAFTKTLISENETATRYALSVTCKARSKPPQGQLGLVDFIADPGTYASVGTYKNWILPPVAATPANFRKVRDGLFAKVAAGNYAGAMSTLSKRCSMKVSESGDAITIEHETLSSNRTRRVELKAADLLGYAEGKVFVDPIRIDGPTQGTFAAAEFLDGKGGSLVVRFEKNDNLEGLLVRINGSDTYCRRLQ